VKKIGLILCCLFLAAAVFAGCGGNDEKEGTENSGEKLSVVTTIFPLYDWAAAVSGGDENADLTLMLDNGVDLHSFQPTADDIVTLSDCDVFIYVGGESDQWVEDALKTAVNQDMIVVNLMDVLADDVKEEEVVEGMQAEEEAEEAEEEGPELDEHVWLSLRNAVVCCGRIVEALGEADPERKDVYAENAAAYVERLTELDTDYTAAVAEAAGDTLLFGDRFPFRYLVDDYGLSYYAAFVGCSAETEADFETIAFLASKVDELSLPAIMQIETSDGTIAETIRSTTKTKDQAILTLNSMQSTTAADIENGVTYLSVMEDNLAVLKKALQ
jgi:zinc transport system substrate-binding protein